MLTVNTFPNVGYLIADLPQSLFDQLKKECEVASNELISGLSDIGVPKHYFLEKNKDILGEFIMKLTSEYNIQFPQYLDKFKILSRNAPFKLGQTWINIGNKGDYIPNHVHAGFLSFSIWIKVPYETKEETDERGTTSKFSFMYTDILGQINNFNIDIDKSYEGKVAIFPSLLTHCVYPFFSSVESRISISGNVLFDITRIPKR